MAPHFNPSKATKATPIKKAYKDYKKKPFLEAYAIHGTIWRAAKGIGISRDAVHDWRRRDQGFAKAFEDCSQVVTERLEDTALTRALAGENILLIFLLKSRNPQKYSERYRHEMAFDKLNDLLGTVIGAVKRVLPQACSACQHPIDARKRLAQELDQIADQYEFNPTSS